jgi:hypothetical protein
MRHWLRVARRSADRVADDPALWVPGALAWLVTAGWIPLLAATWRPSTSGLTYLGAGLFTSGAWPWNAIAVAVAAFGAVALAFGLAAVGEGALLGLVERRAITAIDVLRLLGIAIVVAAPALVLLMTTLVAAGIVAPAEFNAPGATPGPLVRTAGRLAPLLVAVVIAAVAGAALHAGAARRVVHGRVAAVGAIGRGAGDLRRGGRAAVAQVVALATLRLAYLAFATILLAVLWAPIGVQLTAAADAGTGLLLVGFVAVWLCLVLGGGALQAWGTTTWSGILHVRGPAAERTLPTEVPTGT